MTHNPSDLGRGAAAPHLRPTPSRRGAGVLVPLSLLLLGAQVLLGAAQAVAG